MSDVNIHLSPEEEKAISSLRRVAKKWPKSLWLFSASGSLCVMRSGPDGEHVHVRGGQGEGMDKDYIVETIQNISNDGGDW